MSATITTYAHDGLEFAVASDGTYFRVTLDGRHVGQLVRPRTYSREGWTFTANDGKQLTKHAFLGEGTARRMYTALIRYNHGCSCCENQLAQVGCACPAVDWQERGGVGVVHPRLAVNAVQIAALDDQSVILRYRQLAARSMATQRGDATLRDLFAAEATKRNLI